MTAISVPVDRRTDTATAVGHPTAWWGMIILITTESMIFIGLLGAYFSLS
jgi:heme/copper-type cytochrome/quinol oxidase subunit 3